MKYPKGAIRTIEDMEKCFSKPVYMVLPPGVGAEAPRVHPWIIKITPVRIESYSGPWSSSLMLYVREKVLAAHDNGIATEKNLTVNWNSNDSHAPRYYFTNFWHAYAHSLKYSGEA